MPTWYRNTAGGLRRREFIILGGASITALASSGISCVSASQHVKVQPLPDHLITFNSPSAGSRSYRRYGVFHLVEELPFTVEAVLRSRRGRHVDGLERTARLVLLRGTDQQAIQWGQWSNGPTYQMEITTNPGNLEPLVIAAEIQAKDTWVIARPIHIGPQPAPDAPRWIAIGAQRFRDSSLNTQGVGYVWYPGHEPEHSSTHNRIRPGGRIDHARVSAGDYYVQRMTQAYRNEYYPEFHVNAGGAVAAAVFRMQYHPWNSHALRGLTTALFRDGPRNIGSVGFPCAGFVDDDESCVICSAPGRIVRVDLHGNTTTIVGWRLRAGALAPMDGESEEFVLSRFEFVGRIVHGEPWTHIWDVVKDPDSPNNLYIADVDNHCIRRFNQVSGELSIFAGSVNREPGHVDAPGHAARFNKPRGLAFRHGTLYVGDAVNHAIRAINMQTGEVSTVVQSADLHMHEHAHADGFDGARRWARDGAFGDARFMHPQQIRFTSDGCLITPMHHQLQMVEFDLETRQVRTLIDALPGTKWKDQERTWMTLSIDDGTFGSEDTLYYTGWEHDTDHMYTRDGESLGRITGRSRPRDRTGFDAPLSNHQGFGYSQFAVSGKGAIWIGGVSGAGVFRVTPSQPNDPRPDVSKFQRGQEIWRKAPHPLAPSLSLIHGPWGVNGFGEKTIDELGALSDQEFRDWIYGGKSRHDLDADQVDDLMYFVRMESITGKFPG